MKVGGRHYRSIWLGDDGASFHILDQTRLPFAFEILTIRTADEAVYAIKTMQVRGAPLIGACGAYGLAMAIRTDAGDAALNAAYHALVTSRPTAVNLKWALDRMLEGLKPLSPAQRYGAALKAAADMCDEDVAINRSIGKHGAGLIRKAWEAKGRSGVVNILTHCNTGWIATVDYGTALAAIYTAHDEGIPVHVWVDETRPRNQGGLTVWELSNHGVPCTYITDNAGGHLMQHGQVDLCFVGTDRVSRVGDVANKIGTYLKALAAKAHDVPFYVGAPSPSIDWTVRDALREIEIEDRAALEVTHIRGLDGGGAEQSIRIVPEGVAAANPAFDVTPAALVTALVTERGVCDASEAGLLTLFPEMKEVAHGRAAV